MAVDTSKLEKKAKEAADKRNYDYAIDLYLQALKVKPDNLEARQSLRQVERRKATENGSGGIGKLFGRMTTMFMSSKGDPDKRIVKAEEKLKGDPFNRAALIALGKACYDASYNSTAVWVFEDLKEHNKEDIEVLKLLAEVYENTNDVKKALETWEYITKAVPSDREAPDKVKNLHAKGMQEVFDKGSKEGARSIVKDSGAMKAADVAGSLRTAEDYQVALDGVDQKIEERPNDANLYVKKGDLYMGMPGNPDYENARKNYEKAKELSPTEHRIQHKLDDVEIRRLDLEVRSLAQKAKAGDANAQAQHAEKNKQFLLFKLKSYEEREKAYSTDSKIAFELGTLYYRVQKFDDAIKRFQRTVKDPKFRKESAYFLGDSFFRKKQFDLAVRQLTDGLNSIEVKDETWKKLTYLLGNVYDAMDKKEDAHAKFMSIYELDIDYRDVKEKIEGA